jgi:hypothetical protein
MSKQTVEIHMDLLAEAKKRMKLLGFRKFGDYCNELIRRDLALERNQPGIHEGLRGLTADEEALVDAMVRTLRANFEGKEMVVGILRSVLRVEAPDAHRQKQTKAR